MKKRGCAICWHFKPDDPSLLLSNGWCKLQSVEDKPTNWPKVRWHDVCGSWRESEPIWLIGLKFSIYIAIATAALLLVYLITNN